MRTYRRVYLPNATYFFTLVTDRRQHIFQSVEATILVSRLLRACKARWPFQLEAFAVLPDHLHMIWTLPENDSAYSKRIGWMKKEFTKSWLRSQDDRDRSSRGKTPPSAWQARFWEHCVRSDREFESLVDYVHYNPLKHGHARCPHGWRWSTFGRYVRDGRRAADWACTCKQSNVARPVFDDLVGFVGE